VRLTTLIPPCEPSLTTLFYSPQLCCTRVNGHDKRRDCNMAQSATRDYFPKVRALSSLARCCIV
jgi:hypothetical protein